MVIFCLSEFRLSGLTYFPEFKYAPAIKRSEL